jgi:Flp pilus assembly protein TadD
MESQKRTRTVAAVLSTIRGSRRACTTIAMLACVAGCTTSRIRGPQTGASTDPVAAAAATENGDWREAADRWYAVYLADQGRSAKPIAETARALLKLKDAESGNNMVDLGLAKHPDDPELLELKGDALSALQFCRPAEKYYQRATEIDPKRTHAFEGLARVRIELGLASAAVAPLRDVVRLSGDNYEIDALLARALGSAGQPVEAFDEWKKTFEIAPGRIDDVLAASALVLEDDVKKSRPDACATARAWLEHAIATDPQCTRAHFQLGVIAEETGAEDTAIEHYRRAVETDPACLISLTNLAILYSKRGDEARAREMVTRALQIEQGADRRKSLSKLLEPFDRKPEGTKP